jgi:glutamate synthase (ferredoxin)
VKRERQTLAPNALYIPGQVHDACGVGFLANVNGYRSFTLLQDSLSALGKLSHRGAKVGDTSDGSGVLFQIPIEFMSAEAARLGAPVRGIESGDLGIGMVFLPGQNPLGAETSRLQTERAFASRAIPVLGWREVPVVSDVLGKKAETTRPLIEQVIVPKPAGMEAVVFERELFLASRIAEKLASEAGVEGLYFASISGRTVTYKALVEGSKLGMFFPDLLNPDLKVSFAQIHQRYSTNTLPSWENAQPFHLVAHNGEINTVAGNNVWTLAREAGLRDSVWGAEISGVMPMIRPGGSDSANLDNVVKMMALSGRPVSEAMALAVPSAWENDNSMSAEQRAFFEHGQLFINPWDGPALLVFTDGIEIGAVLDRNGLRPARFMETKGGLVAVTSEAGVVPVAESEIVKKGRIGPGQMLVVDTKEGRLKTDGDIKAEISSRRPYGDIVAEKVRPLSVVVPDMHELRNGHEVIVPPLGTLQEAYGMTHEDVEIVMTSMVRDGKDPVWSMGKDTPEAAVLSEVVRPIDAYFKQRFAQVTNPPIDPIREKAVMSLNTVLGPKPGMLAEVVGSEVVKLESPLLDNEQVKKLKSIRKGPLASETLPVLFDVSQGPDGLAAAISQLVQQAEQSVDSGKGIIILSDKGIGPEKAALPMLVALGAVHRHLIRAGKRMETSIVVETGSAWDIHQLALLSGYGADAFNPWLAFQTAEAIGASKSDNGHGEKLMEEARRNYRKAAEAGLLKIFSKMGISTFAGYHGAQIFDSIGLSGEVIDVCFTGTSAPLGGIGFREIGEDVLDLHARAFGREEFLKLPFPGLYKFNRQGEGPFMPHAHAPEVWRALQAVARNGQPAADGIELKYQVYADKVDSGPVRALRDLLGFIQEGPGIDVSLVEDADQIARARFISTAMSLGALGPEAWKDLAIAMNRLGARSNSGEGGEDPRLYRGQSERKDNKIKQVASARFGVTAEYLAMADELEIKMAQGAKPGEGGQLPGFKVNSEIAFYRKTEEGIELISPPPHHDIYSIEDLAQLIYDLKQVNPDAKIGVKLVSESGVGTIAAGVAKAGADYVLIAGNNGGTGAAPLASIHSAGSPLELGLAEAQQALIANGLRGGITLRADGGLQTGRDVVIAAMLGADEFGFGTSLLESLGCVMARQCHLNTCPAGIATQDPEKRARYKGSPDNAVSYLLSVARDVRGYLARLGVTSLDEVIGRTDFLAQLPNDSVVRANTLDLSPILAQVDTGGTEPRRRIEGMTNSPPAEGRQINRVILDDVKDAVLSGRPVEGNYEVSVSDRTIGATLAGFIAREFGILPETGLSEGAVRLNFKGSAGQSFAAFAALGMELSLEGEAQDGVAKSLSGGVVSIRPPREASYLPEESVIVGNAVGYGATSGRVFISGQAGERFAVRNSGAVLTVEGLGDHGCEYMTGGEVYVFGPTGKNFGAGMSAGTAFVLDEQGDFESKVNPDMVSVEEARPEDIERIRAVAVEHLQRTGSPKIARMLGNWGEYAKQFKIVAPKKAAAPAVSPVSGPETVKI